MAGEEKTRFARQIDRWQTFRTPYDWAADAYGRFLHNYPRFPLPGRGTLCPIHLRSLPKPLWIRLGSSDPAIVSEIAERDEYGWILPRISGPIRNIIDLGGNFGLSMRFWDARISSIDRLIVVEPDPDNMRAIRKNSEAMCSAPILVEACVVGWHRQVHLRRGHSESAFSMEDGECGECIRTVTVSDLLSQLADDAVVDLVKCDIEGAEKEVFASCGTWIHKVRNMVIEVHGDYHVEDLKRDIEQAGARFSRVTPSPHRPGVIGFFSDCM